MYFSIISAQALYKDWILLWGEFNNLLFINKQLPTLLYNDIPLYAYSLLLKLRSKLSRCLLLLLNRLSINYNEFNMLFFVLVNTYSMKKL